MSIKIFIRNPIFLKLVIERKIIEFKTKFKLINKEESLKQYEALQKKWKKL